MSQSLLYSAGGEGQWHLFACIECLLLARYFPKHCTSLFDPHNNPSIYKLLSIFCSCKNWGVNDWSAVPEPINVSASISAQVSWTSLWTLPYGAPVPRKKLIVEAALGLGYSLCSGFQSQLCHLGKSRNLPGPQLPHLSIGDDYP